MAANFSPEVRLRLRSAELAGLDLFHSEPLQAMPDHWEMPAGFDQRDFFLVGAGGWMEAMLPFQSTSSAASGTPAYVRDRDTAAEPAEPDIASSMHVYSSDGHRVGDVEAVEVDEASGRITRIVVRRGFLFGTENERSRQHDRIGERPHHTPRRAEFGAAKKLERRWARRVASRGTTPPRAPGRSGHCSPKRGTRPPRSSRRLG